MVIAAVAIGFIVSKNTYKAGSKLGSTNTTTVNALFGPNGSKLTGS